MDIKNTVSPNKLFGNSPVNNFNNQNKESTVYLKKYNWDLLERRVGRYLIFVLFLIESICFLYNRLDEGRVITLLFTVRI